METIFDDTWFFIERNGEEVKCRHSSQYEDAIGILLSDSQQEKYTGDYTQREFKVSDKKWQAFKEYMADNIWNKK